MTGFVFEQALTHFRGLFALLLVNPVADLALRRGRPNKTEPIAARAMALLGENLNHLAAVDFLAKGHHLAGSPFAHPLVAPFRVDHFSKNNRGRAPPEVQP